MAKVSRPGYPMETRATVLDPLRWIVKFSDTRPSRRLLWKSLARSQHTLTAATTTPKTFDESGDWRAGLEARTR
jgi:hypothetical protein